MEDQAATPSTTEEQKVPRLPQDATTREIVDAVNAIADLLFAMNAPVKRDRGPRSTRDMTEEDAKVVILGELKTLPHGKAAEKLGLSYGQVYSARKGYTHKPIYQEGKKIAAAAETQKKLQGRIHKA